MLGFMMSYRTSTSESSTSSLDIPRKPIMGWKEKPSSPVRTLQAVFTVGRYDTWLHGAISVPVTYVWRCASAYSIGKAPVPVPVPRSST